MQAIPLILALPGLTLAKDIENIDNPDGPPICGKGVVLNESLIGRLKHMGIQSITVEGHPVKMEGEKTLAEMLEILDKRFKKVIDDPLMKKLKEVYRKNIISSMSK